MAELDDKLLKNLDKILESMNERLLTLETTLSGVKNGLNKTFDPSIITSFSDAIRGLKTLRLIDAEGATKDIQKIKDKIDELEAKWKGDKPLGKGESFAGIADELARYKALMKDIQKGSEQRTIELANAAKKEADAVLAEERRKQREFQATANEQAKLLKAYSDIERARSVVTGGKKFGELDAEQIKKYKEFGRTLDELKKKMDDLEKTSPGSKAAGTQIFKEQEAITKAKREAAEEQTRIKKEQAEQERRINEAIKEEERKRAEANRRVLEDEKRALADYIRLFSEKQRLLKDVAPLDAKDIRHTGMTEQQRALYEASWNRIYAINDEMAKLRANYVSVLEYEEKIQANGQEQVALSKVRVEQEKALSREKERGTKSEKSKQAEEAKIQRQADAIVKRRIDLERQVQRIDNDRAMRQQTNSKISQQALDAESRKYEALLQRIEQLNNALSKLEGKQKGVTARAEQRNEPYMNYVTAVEEERKAKAIENSNKKLKEQKSTLDSMIPTVQRLASAFGLYFSVRGLAQFGKKLIETRGEFEMQFVAMKQIIGDVDAATKIWNQTMQQALQSPFRAMQLVTYTKQLAAYRIETEKLFDTTKRLADISAGLGVDMGRLILAFGQVKSANFLRASEVRQFTEAGVNIVGNLAQYFTELEGRAVGTAEVMERITKRMVLFSDVEAIFKRMTDEGGEFYNMQEVQSDTVKGQIMKLHDAYDQMLNTIGQANQGTIRNFVDTLNNLVRNWQNVAYVLKANINWITIFGASLYALSNRYMKGATTQTLWFSKALTGNEKVLLKEAGAVRLFGNEVGLLSVKQRIGVIAMRSFQGAIMAVGSALSALWPLLVFEGITLLVERLTRANRELKRFKEELQEVASTNVSQMNEEINGYDSLIERLKRTTEGTMARKEVLDEISRRYGKYLDFIITEKTSVEQLAGAYDKVVSSIRNYTAEKIREEQMQRVEKGIYDEYQDLISNLIGSANFNTDTGLSKDQAKAFAKYVQSAVKDGVTDSKKIIEDYFQIELPTSANTPMMHYVRTYIDQYKNMYSELQDIRDDVEGVTPVFATEAEYQTYKKNVEDANKEIAAQNELYQGQVDLVKQKTEEQWKLDDEIAKLRLENEEEILRIRKEYGLISEGQYNDELARLHGRLDSYETDYNKRLENALAESYGESWQTEKKEARDMYNYVVSTEQALAQGTTQRNKQLKDSYKGFKESLEQYNAQFKAAEKSGASKEVLDKIQENIDSAKLMMSAIELAAKLRGIDLSEKKKPGGTKENASKLISLIKEMRSEYDKLSKSAYGYAKSEEKVREAYKQSYEEILKQTGVAANFDFTTNQGEIEALKKVRDYIKGNAKYAMDAWKDVQKTIDQLTAETEIEISVRIREDFGKQMEDMLNNYQLTVELQGLEIDEDLAKEWLNTTYTSLGDILDAANDFANGLIKKGNFDKEDLEKYKQYVDKVEAEILKTRKEKTKEYSRYLEKELSERAKKEMEFAIKSAEVQGTQIFTEDQKNAILSNMEDEYTKAMQELTWKSFKESTFYVEMMDDLTSIPADYSKLMLAKINELLMSPQVLSPRAFKEAINARQKILEAQMQLKPLRTMIANRDLVNAVFADESLGLKKRGTMGGKRRELDKEILARTKNIDILEKEAEQYSHLTAQVEAYEKAETKATNAMKDVGLTLEGATGESVQQELESRENRLDLLKQEEERYKELKEIQGAGGLTDAQQKELKELANDVNERSKKIEGLKAEIDLLGEAKQAVLSYCSALDVLNQPENEDALLLINGGDVTTVGGNVVNKSNLSKQQQENKNQLKNQKNALQRLKEARKGTIEWVKSWHTFNAQLNDTIGKVRDMGNAFYDTYEALGGETDALTEGWKEFGSTMIDAITSALTMIPTLVTGFTAAGVAINSAMGIIGLIAEAIQLVLVLITGLAKLHDAGYEAEIERQQKKIDELQRAYDRLEKQIEKTWDTASYIRTYNEETQNLYAQIEALNKQIAAENSKKNIDADKIQGYKDSIQDAEDELDELKQKQIDVFGGIGEEGYRDAAQEFVDAWKSAFLETGDGLQGLQEHFDEFLNDWFVKQATMRVAGRMLEPLFRQIDTAVDQYSNGGAKALMQELQEVREKFGVLAPQLSEALEELAGMWGLGGEGGLSGLAAGIQGMTEEQANILEAYWNSVRGYTANIDMNVATIVGLLSNGNGGGRGNIFGDPNVETNPMLQQLSLIAANTQATHQLLQSVTKSGHSQGGYGIKVFAD